MHHGAMEEAFGCRHGHQGANFAASAGLAEDQNVAGIAAEIGNVVADPLQSENDIEHADIAGRCESSAAEFGEMEKAKRVEAMVEGDDDYIASPSEIFAVVGVQFLAGTGGISATVKPNHHWALAMVVDGRRPKIDAQTVFPGLTVIPLKHERVFVLPPALTRREGANICKMQSAADAGPRFGLDRRQKRFFSSVESP